MLSLFLRALFEGTEVNPLFEGTDVNPLFEGTEVNPLFEGTKVNPLFKGTDVNPLFKSTDVNPLFEGTDVNPISLFPLNQLLVLIVKNMYSFKLCNYIDRKRFCFNFLIILFTIQ